MSVLLIFVDGLGIGTRGHHNPLDLLAAQTAAPLAHFQDEDQPILHDGILAMTDARLGVEGRPQSASGQTTILTGINAPAALGFHKQGFPNEQLREIIRQHSIFLQLKRARIGPNIFANAYSRHFFDARPRWVSATTVAVESAGLQFRTVADVRIERALYHDFTNQLLSEAGEDVEKRTPEAAAHVLADISREHRFTLYEYFLTDRMGHQQDFAGALAVLTGLAAFVRAVLDCIDLSRTTVMLTSDHGNIEDLSVRNHTLNHVPTLAWGAQCETVKPRVRSLADITPTIIEILTQKEMPR
ncbi:MAG: metalloenzyme [Acidobacteriota bacterium]|nr:metalloenzyme [Acidobacteriota bacterium]